jgi:hypothetical protein
LDFNSAFGGEFAACGKAAAHGTTTGRRRNGKKRHCLITITSLPKCYTRSDHFSYRKSETDHSRFF